MTKNSYSRRVVLALGLGAVAASSLPALALSNSEAENLVTKAVADINKIIATRKSEAAMLRDFEAVFSRYADVNIIALTTLGPARRSASKAQVNGFVKAFSGYFTRKYGKRFNEFVGGEIIVKGTRKSSSYIAVNTTANLKGSSPFAVDFHISDKSGKARFFNIIIEGVNTLSSERVEIGAMLDRRGGDIDKLIADLKTAG
jgi:phospholipid transport system substrate-binding protein